MLSWPSRSWEVVEAAACTDILDGVQMPQIVKAEGPEPNIHPFSITLRLDEFLQRGVF